MSPSRQVTIQGVMTWEDSGVNVPVFPTHPIAPGGPPLGIWGGAPLPTPTPPIYYPQPPLGIWGGAPLPTPTPPIYFPPGVNVPVFPTHPIAPGGPPPGYWGGAPLPTPTPPIYFPPGVNVPVFPTHPIAPGGPPYWGGVPTHPIVIPPDQPPPPEGGVPIQPIAGIPVGDRFVAYFAPGYGWVLVPAAGPIGSGENPPDAPEPAPKH
jgi:hypothetical protein